MIGTRMQRLCAKRRLDSLRHMRRMITIEILRRLRQMREERARAQPWRTFRSKAAWERWCEQDRADESGEQLHAEQCSRVTAAAFEARREVDPPNRDVGLSLQDLAA